MAPNAGVSCVNLGSHVLFPNSVKLMVAFSLSPKDVPNERFEICSVTLGDVTVMH